MSKNYVAGGKTINYTNGGAAIASGDVVVVGAQIGVALAAIANGAVGELSMEGVHSLPKLDAAVIAQGEEVVYDVSSSSFDDNAMTPAAGDVSNACIAWEGKGATSGETIQVKINVGVGTVA
jgi:predicted RecA/RadA family phage recombinase